MKRPRKRTTDIDYDTAAALVMKDYTTFLSRAGLDTPLEPKDFLARHNAARGALAHLEHLEKMAGPDDAAAGAVRQALIEQARTELGVTEAADAADE